MDQLSTDIMLFTTRFKKTTTILANAYYQVFQFQSSEPSVVLTVTTKALEKRLDQIEVNVQSIANKILHAPTSPPTLLSANNDILEKKVD